MDKYSLYAAQFLPFTECFAPKGHAACKGCGMALAVRQVCKALDGKAADIEKAAWQIPWQKSFMPDDAFGTQLSLLSIARGKDKKAGTLDICFDNDATDGKADSETMIKRLPAVAAAGGYAYVATACPSHPFDLVEKVRTAWEAAGTALV